MDRVIGKLSPDQFWKWQAHLAEVQKKEAEYQSEQRYLGMLEKDLEISRLRALIFKSSLDGKKAQVNSCREKYAAVLDQIEKEVGFSISGNIIDDVTLEVKELENKPS